MNKKFCVLISVIIISLIMASCARKPQSTFTSTNIHPQKTALLLPLHGSLASSGTAIRNGFLAAYYYSLQHGQSSVSVKIIDTSQGDVATLYQQALAQGAEFIVGPLTKQNVRTIINKGSLPVPTLALNTIDDYTKFNTHNLYQFGLSSQDEATQIANKAWQQHPGRALIIAPYGAWGQNIANTMQQTWQSLGGTVVTTMFYSNSTNLAKQIQHVFNIDISQNNAKSLARILWRQFKFTPRRRHDIDVIFLSAFPKKARQIKPLLNFYFAGNIPVYATSTIYSGIPQPHLDNDLDGIIFCDMPWLLQNPSTLPEVLQILQNDITRLWPNSYKRYNRLYALGIDAYYLMLNLNKLLNSPHAGIAGATGLFYLDNYNHIYRQLNWTRMQNGIPRLLPK